MATRTPYYGLSKPAGIEDAQISVINANMDILDTELHLTTVRDAKNLAPIYDATSSYVEGDYVTYLITGQSSQDANGYFVFKCIDDTTEPAGNFDTNKWEAVCITDEMGSGGGGGGEGGHIFLDNEGTAMPQRAKAKFEGAYSTDNSTDGITNVAVMRTMSGIEYAQLTEEEKQGIIYVDDETTGTDDKFQPVIYSTEEREIGVWIDGKPLYQKTVITPSGIDISVSSSSWTNTGIDVSSLNIEKIISSFGISTDGTYQGTILAYIENDNLTVQTTRNGNGWVVSFTIQYTKSTDTAGSGQWTPQGVPAVHYSTDEQVIGTWIDGKTLYQKTVIKDSNFVSGANEIAHNISNVGKIISNESTLYYNNGDCVHLPAITLNSSGWTAKTRDFGDTYFYLDLGSDMLSYVASASFTLRYTKASS